MANAALGHIGGLGSVARGILRECAGPSEVIGVQIQDAGLGIGSLAAPFGATIETGKDDGVFAHGEGDELAIAPKGAKMFQCPGVGFGRAIGEQIFGEALARIGSGPGGQRLFGRGHLSGHVARGTLFIFDRK